MKYYIYVAEERSISKGAKKAHVSQSALSQMIQKFEEDLGHVLLERSNRGISLTDEGEIVYSYAKSIINKYETMLGTLESFTDGQNSITISGTTSLAAYSLPCMLYKIKKEFPDRSYILEAREADEIIRNVKDGLTDFGFIDIIDPEDEQLKFWPMGRERIVLIAQSEYKIPDRIKIEDLCNIEMVICTNNWCNSEKLEQELQKSNQIPCRMNVIFNADSLTAVKSSVINGYGIAFVPYGSIKHELYEKQIKLIELENFDLDYDIFMVTSKPKAMRQPAKALLQYLIEAGISTFC